MKSCPGLRAGIDSRHPFRHSSESWNPEGVGRGATTRRWKKPSRPTILIFLIRPSQGHGDSRESLPSAPLRLRESSGVVGGTDDTRTRLLFFRIGCQDFAVVQYRLCVERRRPGHFGKRHRLGRRVRVVDEPRAHHHARNMTSP